MIYSCRCDVCNLTGIENERYHCLVCQNYDLCKKCFDGDLKNMNHLVNHPVICFRDEITDNFDLEKVKKLFSKSVHKVMCNGCSKKSIQGLLFKCKYCKTINFCYDCFLLKKEIKNHSANHPYIVIGT